MRPRWRCLVINYSTMFGNNSCLHRHMLLVWQWWITLYIRIFMREATCPANRVMQQDNHSERTILMAKEEKKSRVQTLTQVTCCKWDPKRAAHIQLHSDINDLKQCHKEDYHILPVDSNQSGYSLISLTKTPCPPIEHWMCHVIFSSVLFRPWRLLYA